MKQKLLLPFAVVPALAGCQDANFFARLTAGEPVISDDVWLRVPGKVQDIDISKPNYIPSTCFAGDTASAPVSSSAAGGAPYSYRFGFVTYPSAIVTCAVDMKTLVDRRFDSWMDTLAASDSGGNTLVDVTVIGAGLAGGLAGGATSQIMNAVSSGLTGTKSTVDKDVFLTQSLQTIITQMHTDRAKWATIIDQRIQATLNGISGGLPSGGGAAQDNAQPYVTLADVMNDLQTYSRQGSFRNALYNLQTNVAAQSAACQAARLNQKAGITTARAVGQVAHGSPATTTRGTTEAKAAPAGLTANPASTTTTSKCPDSDAAPTPGAASTRN